MSWLCAHVILQVLNVVEKMEQKNVSKSLSCNSRLKVFIRLILGSYMYNGMQKYRFVNKYL